MQNEQRTHHAYAQRAEASASSALGELIAALNHVGTRPPQAPAQRAVVHRPAAEPSPAEAPEGVYIISVAARMLAMHPQTLRKYERVGLIRPSRTVGMLRLYSEEDVAKLRVIRYLVEELRLNLAGVEVVISMLDRLNALRQEMEMGRKTQTAVKSFERALAEILGMLQGNRKATM